MRVIVVGAGPAGLYCAYLIKRQRPDADVDVLEQNPEGATFGFGVVFSDRALEFLGADDPDTLAAIHPHLEAWKGITLSLRGEPLAIDGVGFTAIGRLELLLILQERLRSVGVVPQFNRVVGNIQDLGEADLVVGADGSNSWVRRSFKSDFGASVTLLSNHFSWYGTRRRFETLTQTFRKSDLGYFNAHHYRFSPAMSTFIVEVDADTFRRAGFDRMSEDEARRACEGVFAEELAGEPLVSNRSVWRQFPNVRNQRWSHGRYVLVGDAQRTAHFSIGSGTRLAMEDAIALAKALYECSHDIPAALVAYEQARRPIVEKLVQAADASAAWYARFPEHMELDKINFAMSYITRSGRVDREKLRQVSPKFVAAYEQAHGTK